MGVVMIAEHERPETQREDDARESPETRREDKAQAPAAVRREDRVDTLTDREEEQITRRTAPRAVVVYEAIRNEGEEELARSTSALAWSGLAAGLSMGFSLVAEGLLRTYLPDAPWRPLIAKLGYSVGFLIVIL